MWKWLVWLHSPPNPEFQKLNQKDHEFKICLGVWNKSLSQKKDKMTPSSPKYPFLYLLGQIQRYKVFYKCWGLQPFSKDIFCIGLLLIFLLLFCLYSWEYPTSYSFALTCPLKERSGLCDFSTQDKSFQVQTIWTSKGFYTNNTLDKIKDSCVHDKCFWHLCLHTCLSDFCLCKSGEIKPCKLQAIPNRKKGRKWGRNDHWLLGPRIPRVNGLVSGIPHLRYWRISKVSARVALAFGCSLFFNLLGLSLLLVLVGPGGEGT